MDDTGEGPVILLLHGFPHTRAVWRAVTPLLVGGGYRVLAPNLPGVGGSAPPRAGYEASSQADDLVGLLDSLSVETVHVVGFDLGAAPAFALAASRADRVASLTILEAVIGGLAGAEGFLASGGPWWFAFHQVHDGFAEDIVMGSEDRYVRYFLSLGSRLGVPHDLAQEFVSAYSGRDALRAAFERYRAMPSNAAWNRGWAETNRLKMPTTAIGSAPVRDVTARQLATVADDLEAHLVAGSGHILPLDAPEETARIVLAAARRGAEAIR